MKATIENITPEKLADLLKAQEQRDELLKALQAFMHAFNLPDDGINDNEVEPYFRKPVKMARKALNKISQ